MTPPTRQNRATLHATVSASLSGTNIERAGDYNQRIVLQAIRVSGPITRTELGNLTGLTPPAITNITKRLLNDGLIIEVERLHGGRGQPAIPLAINPDGCFSIGVNVDRDHVTLVVLDLLGHVRRRATLEVAFASPAIVADFFQEQIDTLKADGDLPMDRLTGIGVAMPNDLVRNDLLRSDLLRGDATGAPPEYEVWKAIHVPSLFAEPLALPVYVENDATAAALGELQFGHGMRDPSFFYILISHGLGGGLVINGNAIIGANGRSGEIGFLPVRTGNPYPQPLQNVVSLSALYSLLAANGHAVSRPGQLRTLNAAGKDILGRWLDMASDLLLDPLISMSCLINPESVFLGGRLPLELLDSLAHRINRKLRTRGDLVPVMIPVHRAAMAQDAPAIGAAILPFNDRLLPTRMTLMKTAAG
ncbi:MAG: ROK family transcriptional regulator [Azospirillaceae bacterium]|nr:ROK family transcriptional regulator [Azospirillaceae bacterium]